VSNIVEFKRPEAKHPHATGEAFCMRCDHKWTAVAPVGTTVLECPDCKAMAGQFKFLCAPSANVRTCECGNQFFYITQEGHFCPNCGVWQLYD
jgi:hypothetical protein